MLVGAGHAHRDTACNGNSDRRGSSDGAHARCFQVEDGDRAGRERPDADHPVPAERRDEKTLDVVFVVDNAFQADNTIAADQAKGLVEQLEGLSETGNLNINVGLVISGGYVPVLNYDQLEEDEFKLKDIKTAGNQLKKTL